MPKPAYPIAGDVVGVPWATALSDFVGEKWKYVSVGWASPLNNADVPALNTTYDLELTGIPANDPNIVAARCGLRIIDTTGANLALNAMHTGGTVAGLAYTTGVAAAKGGESGSCVVKVGLINNRSIKWKVTGTAGDSGISTCQVYLQCMGYYVAEAGAITLAGDLIDDLMPEDWPIPGMEE